MSSSLRFDVDTNPMGESLLHVANHVSGATVAVEASSMLIARAEEEAAQEVSSNITRGFRTLILSQISQKMAANQASVHAKSAQLFAEKQAALVLEQQFHSDFQRIKERYFHLFDSLNKALRVRITELDKPVFQLVEKEYRQGMWRRLSSVGAPVLAQQELGSSASDLEVGRAKGQISRLLEAVKSYLVKTHQLKKQVSDNLLDKPAGEVRDLSLSCAVLDADGTLAGTRSLTVRFPAQAVEAGMPTDWEARVQGLDWAQGTWKALEGEDRQALEVHLVRLLQGSSLSAREQEFALSLFRNSPLELLAEVPR